MKRIRNYEPLIKGRTKLAWQWIPHNTDTLLDAGCAYGLTTAIFAKEAKNVYGLDANPQFIAAAKEKYLGINFVVSQVEKTPFADSFFDVIILNEVLCYIQNEQQLFDEMFRILKIGGTLIISVPHKGLFSFMDTENYIYFLKKYLPWLYRLLYRLYTGKQPHPENLKYLKRSHYSKNDLQALLNKSLFKNYYEVEKIFRSGLLIGALQHNLALLLTPFLKEKLTSLLLRPLSSLSEIDYWIPYGALSYNLAIKIIKK